MKPLWDSCANAFPLRHEQFSPCLNSVKLQIILFCFVKCEKIA